MQKILILLFIFAVACGPSEDEIQARIDNAVKQATSTTTSSSTTTTSTTTTTLPFKVEFFFTEREDCTKSFISTGVAEYYPDSSFVDLSGKEMFNLNFNKLTQEWLGKIERLDANFSFDNINYLEDGKNAENYFQIGLNTKGRVVVTQHFIENVHFESVITRYPDKDLTWYGYRRNGTAKPFCIEIKYLEPGLYEYAGNLPDVFGFLTALELNN